MIHLWVAGLADRIGRINVRCAGVLLFATIGFMAIMGIGTAAFAPGNPWFDLDSEVRLRWPLAQTTIALPALWSGLLLAGAALTWASAATTTTARLTRVLAAAFALFLLFMAVDEIFSLHERVQNATHIDWMVLYSPLVVLMGLVTFALLVHAWRIDPAAVVLVVAGGALWAFAQVLELIQWDGDFETEVKVPMYLWLMIPEELLEASGSVLLLLAGIRVVRALQRTRASG